MASVMLGLCESWIPGTPALSCVGKELCVKHSCICWLTVTNGHCHITPVVRTCERREITAGQKEVAASRYASSGCVGKDAVDRPPD